MVRLAMLGGFLGAGKTTTLIELGKRLVSETDRRVVIITNDQGEVLVDTETVKNFGFAAAEVLRGCFCCKFEDFVASAKKVLTKANPDIILAEPVGSCTDIPATVCNPIKKYYKDEFELAPFIVLVNAARMLNFSRNSDLLNPKTPGDYLYLHQIQEAEIIGINKIDLVTPEQLESIKDQVSKLNDRAEILTLSAKTGVGLDELLDQILHKEYSPYSYPDVDYDIYTIAEAELGWFNGSWDISGKQELDAEQFIKDLLNTIGEYIVESGGEIAHLKMHLTSHMGSVKASHVMSDNGVDLTGKIHGPIRDGSIIMNARVKLDPESITRIISESIQIIASKYNIEYTNCKSESFSPPPPKPIYQLKVDTVKSEPSGDGIEVSSYRDT